MKGLDEEFSPDWASPPGDTIMDTLDCKEWSTLKFALLMEEPIEKMKELISGRGILTPEIALKLEWVLGIDYQFWINRENNYRNKLKQLGIENG